MSIDKERLFRMLTTYALFDFDGTLIRGDSIILFMRYAWQKKLCSVLDLFRFLVAGGLFTFGLLSPKRAKQMALHFLKGEQRDSYVSASEDFCKNVLIPRLYPLAAEALQKHKTAGEPMLLVSASPTFYLEPLKNMLGFTEVLGTDMETDEGGRFTGKIVGINCRGEEKPLRIQAYLDKMGTQLDTEHSSSYGNSTHDIPMLQLCQNAYAVNAGKRMLRKMKDMDGVTALRWKGRYQVCG